MMIFLILRGQNGNQVHKRKKDSLVTQIILAEKFQRHAPCKRVLDRTDSLRLHFLNQICTAIIYNYYYSYSCCVYDLPTNSRNAQYGVENELVTCGGFWKIPVKEEFGLWNKSVAKILSR